MKIDIKDNGNGITAVLTGFNTLDINSKIEACKSGSCSCDCDPSVMAKIENIEVSQLGNKTQINVTGAVDAATIAPMMQSCLMREK
ncbi:MAG: hypothetical protein AB7D29_06480 [Campylobacterales bacterium]